MFQELDLHLFGKGCHYKLYEVMGARVARQGGELGVHFSVWAPEAVAVSVVGDFNGWRGAEHPLSPMGESGVWGCFIPSLCVGDKYKFELTDRQGRVFLKADPYALYSELRPKTASVVWDVDDFVWQDAIWMEKRSKTGPMNIYEVHLGSYKRADGGFLNYRDLAHDLAAYATAMHFSHVELLPVMEHPLDESWGYQVTGFFSATSRFGTPADFQYFVDYLHRAGIGVILDWVPGHFPRDDFALAHFDGTFLYEHADPRQGIHPHWDTHIFNYGRSEVSNFLIASALFWLDKMHVDGLRVDAVASMLYADYGRNHGEWVANIHGGHENLEAIAFLKHLNSIVHTYFPSVWMCAEESTTFFGVTLPVEQGGLGFDLKWNLGWMHDAIRYMKRDPLFRFHHQDELTFGLLYAFSEHFILPLSHDEVVHGKGSLLSKMPGDVWRKCAQLRLFYSYMMCYPGKKLIFMGCEFGQWGEWHAGRSIDWHLLEYQEHVRLQLCVADVNRLYQGAAALWQYDADERGFAWVDFSDRENGVIAYMRRADTQCLLCIHHFTPSSVPEYFMALSFVSRVELLLSTDREEYGGSCTLFEYKCVEGGICFSLPPLATLIFEVFFDKR